MRELVRYRENRRSSQREPGGARNGKASVKTKSLWRISVAHSLALTTEETFCIALYLELYIEISDMEMTKMCFK